MFERFTDRARRVVVLAQEEARRLQHNYIGTEHLLLGLVHEGEGVAAQALAALRVSPQAVQREVVQLIGMGNSEPSGHIPFTPRAKKTLELSLREALQLSHNYIGTEHILLGLVREGEGVAAQVLVKLGADLPRVREQVNQLVSGEAGARTGPSPLGAAALMGAGLGQAVLGPGTVVRGGDAPELRHVVALGRPIVLGSGVRLTPISLTVWSSFVELRYAADAAEGPPPAMGPGDWAIQDDAGTSYDYAGASVAAAGALLLGTICFTPPPPPDARLLSLLGPVGARLDIELPGLVGEPAAEADEPAGGEGAPEEPREPGEPGEPGEKPGREAG